VELEEGRILMSRTISIYDEGLGDGTIFHVKNITPGRYGARSSVLAACIEGQRRAFMWAGGRNFVAVLDCTYMIGRNEVRFEGLHETREGEKLFWFYVPHWFVGGHVRGLDLKSTRNWKRDGF
jgi:hypothetical protein